MAVVNLIEEDIIKIPLEAKTKPDVIKELVDVLKKAGKIEDAESVFRAVMLRENMGSTGLEKGIAVPHAKTHKVNNLVLAIGISPEGVDFDSLDGEPSKLFFLLIATPQQAGPHIEALSEIARLTRSSNFCKLLLNAKTPKEIVDIFSAQ
ncbi:MAG: PTS sugar transporter subunit IIA [Spirochaetia bacterium]|jgi:fructose-specific phosphotransferase system IIA component|nr:PTS sugar transporter subunit IIA [Spirochaetia bacterium]MBO7093461.1 PTS sugar transporter subunit IIA [Spirochaetia bacterium]MBO7516995.1 PTS sugar transporter subunit IIA [Spirochaetia bacterium]MBP5693385.1 PTS sugar transporter subunit IIA [Bacteroidales bacterium]MBR4683515.1 PTS sugar transporter subunit IIA [Spirochaetia bacterium]